MPSKYPVNDCHEMVQDKQGRIILLTNETKNNILIYNTKENCLIHGDMNFRAGMALHCIMKMVTEFLYITDTVKHQVYKTTMDGKILTDDRCAIGCKRHL